MPSIPFSASAHEFRDLKVLNSVDETCIHGDVNFGGTSGSNNSSAAINRPLPPLPKDDSLEEEMEDSSTDEDKIEENNSADSDTDNNEDDDANTNDMSKYTFESSSLSNNVKDDSKSSDEQSPPLPPKLEKITANGIVTSPSKLDNEKYSNLLHFQFYTFDKHFLIFFFLFSQIDWIQLKYVDENVPKRIRQWKNVSKKLSENKRRPRKRKHVHRKNAGL